MLTQIKNLSCTLLILSMPIESAYAVERLDIDGFEYDNFIVARPSKNVTDYTYYMWGHSPSDKGGRSRPGRALISKDQAFSGNSSLVAEIDSAMNSFIQFYPYDEDNFEYRFVNEQVALRTGVDNWKMDTYNRLRFWVKADPNLSTPDDKQTNLHFGTYYRSSTGKRNRSETNGDHGYHYYNIEATGEWHQIIVDFHPSHLRGEKGTVEHGVMQYPTGEKGFNYFDLMTRFYVKFTSDLKAYPGKHYLDGFEVYYDPNPENVKQVYALSGVYVPKTKQVIVAWKRDKNEDKLAHEVRYSFTSIHATGWNSAKSLPNSKVVPRGVGGWNGMKFKTTTDQLVGFTDKTASVFIGIKPDNSDMFREIEVQIGSIIRPLKTNLDAK